MQIHIKYEVMAFMQDFKNYKNKIIHGEKIILRPLLVKDMESCLTWLKDPEVNKYLNQNYDNLTIEQELQWLNFIQKSDNDIVFAIIIKNNKKYIGNCALHKINWSEKTCEFGIVLGEKIYWNRGYGSDAVRTIIKVAIEDLLLSKVTLHVYEYNLRAKKVYENCGFKFVKILKNEHFYDNKYWDTYEMEY